LTKSLSQISFKIDVARMFIDNDIMSIFSEVMKEIMRNNFERKVEYSLTILETIYFIAFAERNLLPKFLENDK